MTKQLIVNADDFGRTLGVSEGILQAHRKGIVTSTTAMMNMPSIEVVLRLARREVKLGLGIHLNFTAGHPVLPAEEVRSLVDDHGAFLRPEIWQASLSRLDVHELWAEWQAQLALFHAIIGKPDHLDCHHWVHMLPPIFEIYLQLAQQEGVPVRVPFPPEPIGTNESEKLASRFSMPEALITSILQADRALLQRYPVRHPDYFCADFFGAENLSLQRFFTLIDELPEGTSELMTHPGIADASLQATSSYHLEREQELAILCDPAVSKYLLHADITLVNFGALH